MKNLCVGFVFGALCLLAIEAGGRAAMPVMTMSSQFKINHEDPEASVPSIAARNAKPLEFGYYLQDLATFAEAAAKAGDHHAEARYYQAFAKAVPDASGPFSKLCAALEAGGEHNKAIAACRDTLGRKGVEFKDYARFVRMVLAKPVPMTAADVEDVTKIVEHLQKSPETRIAGTHLQCKYALHAEDLPTLRRCAAALAEVAPRDPKTITFEWALAVREGDQPRARRLIGLAKLVGVQDVALARMEEATTKLGSAWRRWILNRRALLAAAVLVAFGATTFVLVRRRRTSPRISLEARRPAA